MKLRTMAVMLSAAIMLATLLALIPAAQANPVRTMTLSGRAINLMGHKTLSHAGPWAPVGTDYRAFQGPAGMSTGTTFTSSALREDNTPVVFWQSTGLWGGQNNILIEANVVGNTLTIRGATDEWTSAAVGIGSYNAAADQSRLIVRNDGLRYGVVWGDNVPSGWVDAGGAVIPTPTPTTTPQPIGSLGDVNGDGVISYTDATMLRAYIAASNKTAFLQQNSAFSLENANIGGHGGNEASLALLRQYLAATNPSPDTLRIPKPNYYINISPDDGPQIYFNTTDKFLDAFLELNLRPEVVCGRNPEKLGVAPCRPGVGCGTVCGTQSRAQATFFVMGREIAGIASNGGGNQNSYLMRMLDEGHEIGNHSWNHDNLSQSQIDDCNAAVKAATIGAVDYYGNTYPSGYTMKYARPPRFEVAPGSAPIDKNNNMAFIYSGLDGDDWRGHTAKTMADFILFGGGTCPQCGDNACNISWVSDYRGAASGGANGGVILLHDGGGHDRTHSANFISQIIPPLQEMGYHFVTVDHMFKHQGLEPQWLDNSRTVSGFSGTWLAPVNQWIR